MSVRRRGRVPRAFDRVWQIRGKTVPECIRTAQYTARVILQHAGCTYPSAGPDPAYL